jgi:hypothetical protein
MDNLKIDKALLARGAKAYSESSNGGCYQPGLEAAIRAMMPELVSDLIAAAPEKQKQ